MSIGAIVAVVIAAIIVVAAVTLAAGEMRRRALAQRFGPEYDRLASEKGARRAGAELTARQRLHDRLDIRPLTDGERESYTRRWSSMQEQFVDDPNHSVSSALSLITAVLKDRGYPTDDGDETMRAVSVEHARALQDYRKAQEVAEDEDDVSTEDLRQALLGYRRLFRELTGPSDAQSSAWAPSPLSAPALASAPAPAPAPAPASVPAPAKVPAPAPLPASAWADTPPPAPGSATDRVPPPIPVPVPFPASVRARMARMRPGSASAEDTTADNADSEAEPADHEIPNTGRESAMKELPHDNRTAECSGSNERHVSGRS